MNYCNYLVICVFLSVTAIPQADMTLKKAGEEVECIERSTKVYDDYCIEVDLHPEDNLMFTCSFEGNIVYRCVANDNCKAEGLLKNIAFQRDDMPCRGISFIDIYPKMMGRYICKTSSGGQQELTLRYCDDTETSTNVSESQEITTEANDLVSPPAWLICVGVVLLVVPVLAAVICMTRYIKNKKNGLKKIPQEEMSQ